MSTPGFGSVVERDSQTWRVIEMYVSGRLQHLSETLEHPQSEGSTSFTRGQIKELRLLLAAARPPNADKAKDSERPGRLYP